MRSAISRKFGLAGLVAAMAAIAAIMVSGPNSTSGLPNVHGSKTLRLAYFPNLTHAPAMVGVSKGFIGQALPDYKIDTEVVNAGPEAMEALTAGAIDAAYVGPSPALNTYIRSGGTALTIVAGACEGGASLLERAGLHMKGVVDLKGKKVAIPQVGGTQDVSLRHFLAESGLASADQGGDVTIMSVKNPDVLGLFKRKELDAAWVPEPWAARLEVDGGASQVVDERDLWPERRFTTTVLVVSTKFATAHPDAMSGLIAANHKSVEWITANTVAAKAEVNKDLTVLTGKSLSAPILDKAWGRLAFVADLNVSSLSLSLNAARQAGYLKEPLPDMTNLIVHDPRERPAK